MSDASEDWKPGSFTKNFTWGPVGDGLLRLHESIRLGFNYQMADVTRADFRHRVPDMIIGAIAEVESIPIVTANPNDFVSYFPAVQLIKP